MKYVNYLLSDMFLLKTTLQRGRVLTKFGGENSYNRLKIKREVR